MLLLNVGTKRSFHTPTIVGVFEVENQTVLNDLATSNISVKNILLMIHSTIQ